MYVKMVAITVNNVAHANINAILKLLRHSVWRIKGTG